MESRYAVEYLPPLSFARADAPGLWVVRDTRPTSSSSGTFAQPIVYRHHSEASCLAWAKALNEKDAAIQQHGAFPVLRFG